MIEIDCGKETESFYWDAPTKESLFFGFPVLSLFTAGRRENLRVQNHVSASRTPKLDSTNGEHASAADELRLFGTPGTSL